MAKVRPVPVSQPQSKPVSGPPRSRVMRTVGKGYSDAGASYVKKALKGFLANSGSPAEDIDYNNYTLRQRSRMLYMAAPSPPPPSSGSEPMWWATAYGSNAPSTGSGWA